jgi:SAM-dependent methyltransferase
MKHISICPICGSRNLKPKWYAAGYHSLQCLLCHGIFIADRPSLEELAKHYNKNIDPSYDEENKDQLCYYYKKLANTIKSEFARGGKIFDVGCSKGWFFDFLPGWECYGNELNKVDAAIAEERYPGKIYVKDFDACPEFNNTFDIITMQDVLDHLIDPNRALEKANRMLKHGGIIVIKVHDWGCLYAMLTGPGFYAYLPPYHLTFFNKKSLEAICERNGFKITKHKHYSQRISISKVFFRLSKANKKSLFYKLYSFLETTPFKNISINKNLNDIVTIFAQKVKEIN